MPPDTMTAIAVLSSRMDDVRSDLSDIKKLLERLPQQFIPRAELDERRSSSDIRLTALEDGAKTQVSGRRWAIGLCSTGLLSTVAIAMTAVQLAH